MTARALRFDEAVLVRDDLRVRTRRAMILSGALHAVLLAWLVMPRPQAALQPELTEITMLTPGELEPAAAPAGAPAAPVASTASAGVAATSPVDRHFERLQRTADVAPVPQSHDAAADRLNARLAALQENAPAPIAAGTAGAPSAMWSAPASAGSGGTGVAPIALHRGGDAGGHALGLTRGGEMGLAPAVAGSGAGAAIAESKPAAGGESVTARRVLAGAALAGPIADRAILQRVTPVYPEWAKHDGVEGAVTLYFVVRADGSVKEDILVQKTAGFGDFDDNARAALSAWRFEPLHDGRTGEQWGTITFHFRLRDAQTGGTE